jgi:predicted nucleic acid-binding protein
MAGSNRSGGQPANLGVDRDRSASALRRKKISGALSAVEAHQLWQQFQQDIHDGQLTLLPLTGAVIDQAVHILDSLADSVSIRSLDTVHLATIRVFNLAPLATNDARMLAAARALGIAVV